MSFQNKMICPACGAEMNHHAEKLVYASPAEPGYDPSFGLSPSELEADSRPGCGSGASRRGQS
jgi:hypothetical protein